MVGDIVTKLVIQKILDKFNLGTCTSLKKFSRGIIGAAYDINGKIVLKLNLDSLDDYRAERNAFVAQLLAKHNVPVSYFPVSKVLALDTSKEIIPKKYVLFTKLEGDDLEEIWEALPQEEQQRIFLSLGEMLARIHCIKMQGFGFILGEEQFKTWADFIVDKYASLYQYMEMNGLLSKKILEQLHCFFEENRHLVLIPVQPVLVHNDFQPKNVKYADGKITGIFDFDESIAGHNEYDFIKFYLPFKHERTKLTTVLEGYQKHGGVLSSHFPLRIRLYTLLFCMDLLRYIHSNNIRDEDRAEKFRKAMVTILEEGNIIKE